MDKINSHEISEMKLLQHLLNSTPTMRNYDLVWIDNEYMQLLFHGQDERDYFPLKGWSVRHFRSVVFRKWGKQRQEFQGKRKSILNVMLAAILTCNDTDLFKFWPKNLFDM